MQLSDQGHVGIFQNKPVNNLDINGNLSVGYTNAAPANSLIVERNVGVGLNTGILPRAKMKLVGLSLLALEYVKITEGFYIKGQGNSKLLIGGLAKDDVYVFAKGDMSIKNGLLTIRNGNDSAFVITRTTSSTKTDRIAQIESARGLRIKF